MDDTMSEKDGGAAFPSGNPLYSVPGMTLRDYFAGQALIGATLAINDGLIDTSHDGVARMAYKYADAMLAERAALSAARPEGGR